MKIREIKHIILGETECVARNIPLVNYIRGLFYVSMTFHIYTIAIDNSTLE